MTNPVTPAMMPFMAQRRALEMRLEQSKTRLRDDVAGISTYLRAAMGTARHNLVAAGIRVAIAVGAIGALVLIGVGAAVVRRRRRLRVTWR